MQRSLYFKNEGQLLTGTLHSPQGRRQKFPAVVLFHGFGGHKIESHMLFVATSRALEKAGIVTFRFDFRGSGESEGAFSEITPSGEISDGLRAVEVLMEQPEVDAARVGILGLSLGGLVASAVAGQLGEVKSVVLWSAVANLPEVFLRTRQLPPRFQRHLPDFLVGLARLARTFRTQPQEDQQEKLAREGQVDLGGMVLGRGFLEDLGTHDPLKLIRESRAPLLVLHGTEDTTVPPRHAALYLKAGLARNVRTQRVLITGADHTYARADWQTEVIERSVAWFKDTLQHFS